MTWSDREGSRDKWHEKYVNDVLKRIPDEKQFKPSDCRAVLANGRRRCKRPIVRSGYCILHAPKLTAAEKANLSTEELQDENSFEEAFKTTIEDTIQQDPNNLDFESVHFPGIKWKEYPWRGFLDAQSVTFGMAVFHQSADLSGVLFRSQVSFRRAVFRDFVNLSSSTFKEGADFGETIFEDRADFRDWQCDGWVGFVGTRFLGQVRFNLSHCNSQVFFKGDVDNPVFHSDAIFRRLDLSGNPEITFESLSLSKASFAYTDIGKLNFRTVTWHQRKSHILGGLATRKMLWDEQAFLSGSTKRGDYDAVIENYNHLVLSHESRRDFETAEDFHIGEMEVRRLLHGISSKSPAVRRFRQIVNPLGLYSALSSYGSSYWRAFCVLLFLIAFFSIGFLFTGLSSTAQSSVNEEIRYVLGRPSLTPPARVLLSDFFASLGHTLGILTFQRERAYMPSSTISYLWQAIAAIALTGQAALLLLAIRRRFKR